MKYRKNKRIYSFDTEDDSCGNLTLFCGYDGKKFDVFDIKDFTNEVEMRLQIISHMESVTADDFFAHNLEYDLNNIFGIKFYKELELFYSGRLIFAKWRDREKLFLDSFNLSFAPLKSLGKIVGKEKIEVEGEFYNADYCKRDAEIVHDYVKKFRSGIKSEFKLQSGFTLAGTSQKIFLKLFDEFNLGGKNVEPELLNAYYGGRCEAFHIGEVENIFEIDVNSMYPFVMESCLFPTGEHFESDEPLTDLYVAHVKVTVKEETKFPILPYRSDKLFFPTGEFETWVTSVELQKAQEEGQIEKIKFIKTFNFTEKDRPFQEFVSEFYAKRKIAKETGDDFNSNLYKLILNSCYGRFCLHKGMNVISGADNDNEDFTFKEFLTDELSLFDYKIESDKNKNYAVGLFVTAYARVKLYEIIKKVVDNGFMPLYCDTDSCYFTIDNNTNHRCISDVRSDVSSRFNIDFNLGGLSLDYYPKGNFINAKVYTLEKEDGGDKIKTKGIPEKHRKEFIETGKVTYKRPVKLKPMLRGVKGFTENEWIDFSVERHGVYSKRTVFEDGSTKPLILKPGD